MTDSEILCCDFQEWSNYLADKYYIMPITVFETNIEKTLSETKVKQANMFCGSPYEPDFFEIDGVQITFKIPYDGEPGLFDVHPSTYILSRFSTQNFISPQGDECRSFTLEFKFTKENIQSQGQDMAEFVQKQFENEFDSYKKMISYVNAKVEAYNNSLRTTALQLLTDRKKKADSFLAISNALQIPITASKNAPNTTPIQLKRIARQSLCLLSRHQICISKKKANVNRQQTRTDSQCNFV